MLLEDDNFGLLYRDPESTVREPNMISSFVLWRIRIAWVELLEVRWMLRSTGKRIVVCILEFASDVKGS